MKLDRFRDRFFEGTSRYRWLETIGRGGMGVVFKAQDLDLDEVVAIKVLSPDMELDDHELLLRFKREINLNRKIKHPNVARIHDFGTSGDYPYITMEYVPGRNLRRLIQDEGRLAPAVAVSILRQIALGTQAAHKLGIIHRDLKSPNVVVDDSGAVAILDFGLARGTRSENVTLDSVLIGTPHYMAPEQALGKPTDARSDLYSIGVIAFECLTGRVPFTGEAPLAIAMKHVNEPVPDTLSQYADIPDGLIAAVHKALEKSPEARYQTAAEMENGLAELQLEVQPEMPSAPDRIAAPTAPADSSTPDAYRTIHFAAEPISASPVRTHVRQPTPPRPIPAMPEGEADAGSRTIPASGGIPIPIKTRPPVILVAQDDAVERRMIVSTLKEYGCATREARTGQETLEGVMTEAPDLVLLDVKLPDMDGFDVTRILKSQAKAGLPVVLTSSRLDRNRYAFGIQSGATDLLGKPLQLDQMAARVWNILQHRGFIPPEGNEQLAAALKASLPDRTPSIHG